jgi:alanyl-tRNA synthetase
MGTNRDGSDLGQPFSIELCGGTHVGRTGDIGLIAILSESAVGAGVRRIEAVTGESARRFLLGESRSLREMAGLLKAAVTEAPERLASLIEERRRLERDLADARRTIAMGATAGAGEAPAIREVAGIKLMARAVQGIEMRDLKSLADEGKRQLGSGIVAIVGIGSDGKAGLVVAVSEDLVERFDAVSLVRVGAAELGGKGGGGRRDMAQAGGPDGTKAEVALAAIEAALAVTLEPV